MKNKLAVISTFLLFGIIVVLMGYAIINIVLNPQRPLKNADIPQETIDWFKGLIDGGSDIGGIFNPDDRDSTSWGRYDDIDSMLRVEDDYFVIYYSTKDSAAEHRKALVCQRYAREAIPEGEKFMKRYPYPSMLNGRKLPIYLANSVKDFRIICKQLGHGDPGTGAIGLYCFQFGLAGVYTDGIILSPEAWNNPDAMITANKDDDMLRKTLWHEMNHFMYFTNWDYTQTSKPCLWFTEGLAEYFSDAYERLNYMGNHSRYNLTSDFQDGNSEYWVGFSAYLCLEQNYDRNAISNIVTNSYNHSIDESIQMAASEQLTDWNNQWHTFMENKEYRKYMK